MGDVARIWVTPWKFAASSDVSEARLSRDGGDMVDKAAMLADLRTQGVPDHVIAAFSDKEFSYTNPHSLTPAGYCMAIDERGVVYGVAFNQQIFGDK